MDFSLTLATVILGYCPETLCGQKEGLSLIPMECFGNMGFNKTDQGFELIGGSRMGAGRHLASLTIQSKGAWKKQR